MKDQSRTTWTQRRAGAINSQRCMALMHLNPCFDPPNMDAGVGSGELIEAIVRAKEF